MLNAPATDQQIQNWMLWNLGLHVEAYWIAHCRELSGIAEAAIETPRVAGMSSRQAAGHQTGLPAFRLACTGTVMSRRWERDILDPSGRVLVRPLRSEPLRHQAVWAVYEFHQDSIEAIAQSSGLLDLATATSTADALNSSRKLGNSYFKVFRLGHGN